MVPCGCRPVTAVLHPDLLRPLLPRLALGDTQALAQTSRAWRSAVLACEVELQQCAQASRRRAGTRQD